jgi:hypothetical protein
MRACVGSACVIVCAVYMLVGGLGYAHIAGELRRGR